MQVRSYHRAFSRERRIYRIDRWTVPIPGGLPLATSAWFVTLGIAVFSVCQLPGPDLVARTLGWPATMLIAPGAGAVAITRRCEDGRTTPRLLIDRLTHHHYTTRQRWTHRTRPGTSTLPAACIVAGDLSVPARVRVHGPGRVIVRATTLVERVRGAILLRADDVRYRAEDAVVLLAKSESVEVRA